MRFQLWYGDEAADRDCAPSGGDGVAGAGEACGQCPGGGVSAGARVLAAFEAPLGGLLRENDMDPAPLTELTREECAEQCLARASIGCLSFDFGEAADGSSRCHVNPRRPPVTTHHHNMISMVISERSRMVLQLGDGVFPGDGRLSRIDGWDYNYYQRTADQCGDGCVPGCMDPDALNYRSNATKPDATCIPKVPGCTLQVRPCCW